jgi:hypothetical protein
MTMKASMMIALITVILASCASTKEADKTRKAMDSWLGSTKQSLILEWGAPNRVTSDGDGGEVLVYERQTYNGYYHITIYAIRMFYVHADGIIYHWKSESGRR